MRAAVAKIALLLLAILLIGACKAEKLEVPDPSRNKYFKGRNYTDVKEMKLGYIAYDNNRKELPLRNLHLDDNDKREIFKCLQDAETTNELPKCGVSQPSRFLLELDFFNGEGAVFECRNHCGFSDLNTGALFLSEECNRIFLRHYESRWQRPDEGEAGPQRSLGDEVRRRKVEAEAAMKDRERRR